MKKFISDCSVHSDAERPPPRLRFNRAATVSQSGTTWCFIDRVVRLFFSSASFTEFVIIE
jgi:hypothetical protein